jgi:hypothetical protein
VVLPEPEGPSIEKNSPCGISRFKFSTAVTSPKVLFSMVKPTAEVVDAEFEGEGLLEDLVLNISPNQFMDIIVLVLPRSSKALTSLPPLK